MTVSMQIGGWLAKMAFGKLRYVRQIVKNTYIFENCHQTFWVSLMQTGKKHSWMKEIKAYRNEKLFHSKKGERVISVPSIQCNSLLKLVWCLEEVV